MNAISKVANILTSKMASAFNGSGASSAPMTITALSRWSITSNQLPAVDKIKAIHVYDFDNTLFNSPQPNAKLWHGTTLGFLQSENVFAAGGWWHDSRILAATGEGAEKEEPRAWEGWWNEKIVQLVQLSMQQKDCLTVLLTGRRDDRFCDIIKKMVASKNLVFDMIVLKPNPGPNNERFNSTMSFKQAYLISLMETYKVAEEIRIYEDRVRHVKQFREFLTDYNRRQHGGAPTRKPILAEVIQVADGTTLLDPVSETLVIHQIVNDHNLAVREGRHRGQPFQVKKTVFYTGYLISSTDTQRLLTLPQIPANMPDAELKFLANNVLITPRPCPASILDKVGGMGAKLIWEITGTGVFENKIWAAAVRPVPSTAKYYTENPAPIVVLALRRGARPIDAGKIQNWQPVPAEKQFRFETTVGEKVLLRVEEEDLKQDEYESLFPNKGKRKHEDEDLNSDSRQKNGYNSYENYQGQGYQQSGRGSYHNNYGTRQTENRNPRGWHNGHRGNNNNGSGRGRGGGRGGNGGNGRGRGRGAGGGYGYKSLDDMGGGGGGYGDRAQVGYADYDSSKGGQYGGGTNQQQNQQGGGGYQQSQQNGGGYGNYQQHGGAPNSGQGGGLNQYY